MDNTPEIPEIPASQPSGPPSESSESPSESPDVLDDITYILYQASGGKRFANYLIDNLVFYLLWRFLVATWFVQILYALNFPIGNRVSLYLVAYLGACLFLGLPIGPQKALPHLLDPQTLDWVRRGRPNGLEADRQQSDHYRRRTGDQED